MSVLLRACLGAVFALLCGGAGAVTLRNAHLEVELDEARGTLARVVDLPTGKTLSGARDCAEPFRLVLRTPENTIAIVRGGPAPRWEQTDARATAEWRGPLKDESGQPHNLHVRVTYSLAGSDLRIWVTVFNGSRSTLLEVWYPTLGGLATLGGHLVGPNAGLRRPLTLPFGESAPHYPGVIPMAFLDLGGDTGRGLYFGAHDLTARFKLLRVEERKGTEGGTDIAARLQHLPVAPPGRTVRGAAAVFRFHAGGYAGAGRIYREWFVRAFGIANPKDDWIRRQGFFLMTMFMLPEGNINFTFRDIPRWAAEAKRYGLRAVQISGWQRGGHDNGYPYYEPDPRLGTWEDLRRGIAACHRMGLKVYFFVNLQPAMLDLEWYRRELHLYESQNERGEPLWVAGWGMGTLASRMGWTTPLMAFLNPIYPRYSEALMRYFRKLASIGADGVHVDKMFPAGMDFNPRAPLGADTTAHEGAIRFLRRLNAECRAINPKWRISNECAWDRVLTFGTATWWAGNMTAVKEVFPEVLETVGLYQPYDYVGLNNAVRSGHAVMVAPFHFNRGMHEPAWRGLSARIRAVKQIQDRLADRLLFGVPLGRQEAAFEVSPAPGLEWVNWRSRSSGMRACVVTNHGDSARLVRFLGFGTAREGWVRVHRPGSEMLVLRLPARFLLDVEQLAVIEEIPQGRAYRSSPVRRTREGEYLPKEEPAVRPFANADFEGGTLEGWTADENWTVDNNSAGGWYSGWQGGRFAWSGRGGEQKTGRLRSPTFLLSRPGVQVRVAGWADLYGRTAGRWNYVTLNRADGRELARVYAPNTTHFQSVVLDGTEALGQRVYLEAVDDATDATYSMLCIDDVRLVDLRRMPAPPVRAHPASVKARSKRWLVEVDRNNGSIVRLRDLAAGLELITEPRLAGSFRFSLPIRKRESWQNTEANYVLGERQRLTSHRVLPDGLDLHWAGPLRSTLGTAHRVAATMRIRLAGDTVRFQLHLDNRSGLPVGEVYVPILGGLTGIGKTLEERRATALAVPAGAGIQQSRPFHTFNNMSWLGVLGPEQYYAYPGTLSMPWLALTAQRGDRSYLFGCEDASRRLKVAHLEMSPGISSTRSAGNWPRPEERGTLPTGVRMAWVHMPYLPAGRPFVSANVTLRALSGDWRDAARAHGEWLRRSGVSGEPEGAPPRFLEVDSVPFAALAEKARQARDQGKNALLLRAWKAGGNQDGVPTFVPDPSLGGLESLERAARECREQGVSLWLEARINPVSPHSPLYRQALRPFTSVDRWGVIFTQGAGGSPRTTAEMFGAGERRVFLGTGREDFGQWLVERLLPLARAGVEGVALRGMLAQPMDFAPALGSTPDWAYWGGMLRNLERAEAACARERPGFRLLVDVLADYPAISGRYLGEVPADSALGIAIGHGSR